jgi:two-component system, LytTR family, response regulator
MSKYRTLIIDDEEPAREIIKKFLSFSDEFELIGEFDDGFSGLKGIREMNPDLVFLDIQMPRLTGIELLELLENPPVIIFSTAYDQYALKAFEMSATDYLLKPYSRDRFDLALGKALQKLRSGADTQAPVQSLVQNMETAGEIIHRIAVKIKHNVHVIPTQDILFIEAEGDYVMIHTAAGKYLKEKTMKYFETHLDPALFTRIHRSFIVNLNIIARLELYDKEQYVVKLKDGTTLKASSAGYKTLKEKLNL